MDVSFDEPGGIENTELMKGYVKASSNVVRTIIPPVMTTILQHCFNLFSKSAAMPVTVIALVGRHNNSLFACDS